MLETVWNREKHDIESILADTIPCLGHKREAKEWERFKPDSYYWEGKRQKGSSGSIDGWSGNEIADMPSCIWDDLEPLVNNCLELGMAPPSMANARQAHIPKAGKGIRNDGATNAAALRPICIFLVEYG